MAAIVHGDVFDNTDFPGVAIHFDGHDVRAKRVGAVGWLEETRRLKARLPVFREVLRNIGLGRELFPAQCLLGFAFREKLAALEHHIGFFGSEQVGGEFLCLADDFVDAHDYGRAADHRRPAAVGIATVMGDGCVSTHDDDVVDGHAEFVRGDLGEAGLLALAVRRRAGDDGNLARHLDAHAAPFPTTGGHHLRGAERANFNIG